MKPEVEAVLRKIGWDVVSQCHPIFVWKLSRPFELEPLVKRDADARKQAQVVEKAFRMAFELKKALGEFSVEIQRNIAVASENMGESPQVVDDAHLVLWKLMIALEATEAGLRHLGGGPKSGGSKNLQTHAIAFAAATIYFIGMGELPKAYNSTTKDGLGGLFGQSVGELFDVMGLGYSAVGPCKEAIKRLQTLPDEELEALILLRDAETRNLVKPEFRQAF